MNTLKKVCVWTMLLPFAPSLFSQTVDSSLLLKNVDIISLKKNHAKTNYLNEVFTANSLQNQWSELYVKNYGLGQLSTLSVRGMSAENTTILWEGIPINSAMNGVFDLNSIPNSMLQNFSYHIDNNRLTTGGNFSLNQPKSRENYFVFSSTAYLSNLFSQKLEGNINFKHANLSFVNQFTSGANNFTYQNELNEIKKLDDNSVRQINSQVFFNYYLKHNWKINSGVWYFNQHRHIPISEFYNPSEQHLEDKNYRLFVGIKNKDLDIKLSYHNENEAYEDNTFPAFPYNSEHKIQSFKGVINYTKKLNTNWGMKYMLNPNHYMIESTSFADKKTISEAIQQIIFNFEPTEKLLFEAGLKSQINTNFSNFILPFISTTYAFNSKFSTSLIADMNQRTPTANELYYNPGGNIQLKPENNYQIRNVWKYKNQNFYDNIQLNVEPYFLYSRDNIKWLPTSAGSFTYSPVNIAEVKNFGINTHIEWLRRLNQDFSLRTIAAFNYIDSKNEDGMNTIYVPNLKTILSLGLIAKQYEILLQNNYTSKRYANQTNTSELKPYFVSNIKATYKLPINKVQTRFTLGIDNLWNENYQEIMGNYLPLRNYYMNFTAIIK